ncbi:MAG TPA: hypothetical protein VN922_12565, partial [Bacteroidia bacterium]|nr:hypothetical protein [Bacteroidia bacterium]
MFNGNRNIRLSEDIWWKEFPSAACEGRVLHWKNWVPGKLCAEDTYARSGLCCTDFYVASIVLEVY